MGLTSEMHCTPWLSDGGFAQSNWHFLHSNHQFSITWIHANTDLATFPRNFAYSAQITLHSVARSSAELSSLSRPRSTFAFVSRARKNRRFCFWQHLSSMLPWEHIQYCQYFVYVLESLTENSLTCSYKKSTETPHWIFKYDVPFFQRSPVSGNLYDLTCQCH